MENLGKPQRRRRGVMADDVARLQRGRMSSHSHRAALLNSRATRPAALPRGQSALHPIAHLAVTPSPPNPARLRPRPVGPALSQSHSSSVQPLRDAAIADLAVADLALCSASLLRGRRHRTEPTTGSPSSRRPGIERCQGPRALGPGSRTVQSDGACRRRPTSLSPPSRTVDCSDVPSGLADRRPLRRSLRPPPSCHWIEIISAPSGLADRRPLPPASALASPDRATRGPRPEGAPERSTVREAGGCTGAVCCPRGWAERGRTTTKTGRVSRAGRETARGSSASTVCKLRLTGLSVSLGPGPLGPGVALSRVCETRVSQ
ncbi:hypothetical protein Taro_046381 [Colocasia esculenta]|uniref:Uncharacterized protein n=1 Tax=Colocasia esculenta TaxID=4460 RepID=A0A843WZ28_COLES|nr:hypothetical protein [Colocasia esculenta]